MIVQAGEIILLQRRGGSLLNNDRLNDHARHEFQLDRPILRTVSSQKKSFKKYHTH